MHDEETQRVPSYFSSGHIRHSKTPTSRLKSGRLHRYQQLPRRARLWLVVGAVLLLILAFGSAYSLFFSMASSHQGAPSVSNLGRVPRAPGSTSPTPEFQGTPFPSLSQVTNTFPTPTPAPVQSMPPQGSGSTCRVHYTITNQWSGGFQAALTITNMGTTPINGWRLSFSFPNRQTITRLWNGNYAQDGSAVIVNNVAFNAFIPPGASPSSSPGFLATWNGINSSPMAFTLNGVNCTVV